MLGHALVTEERGFFTCQHRRHPQAFLAELFASDCVHASMDLMKPACYQSMPDGGLRVAEVKQLRPCDHTMLRSHQGPRRCSNVLED
jgi:hypothetical protein